MSIEPAGSRDCSLFLRLFDELETGDPPTSEADFAEQIVPHMLIARSPEGDALGYVFATVFGSACYVRHIVTSPLARKKGVGRALLAKVASDAASRGAKHMELNVKLGNVAAIALYESFGMRTVYETVVLRMAWDDVPAAGRHFTILDVDAGIAGEIETRFEMPDGLIASHVASPLNVVRAIRDAGVISAVGTFRTSFPGVFPLRATSTEQALALLASLRPHAVDISDDERPWRSGGVQLTVEDSPAVAEALLRAGASEVFRIAHMKGPLGPAPPGQTMS
jgi:GNAT superfamily N-acetyltransferase